MTRGIRSGLRELTLTVGAVLGTACLIAAIAAVVFDARPLIFRSGSMSPTIETGALAMAQTVRAADLDKGDIVSVMQKDGTRVTHRIIEINHQGNRATLRLKGDANPVPDEETYQVTSAQRVVFDVPLLGYVAAWLAGPWGLLLLGAYAAFLLSVLFQRRIPSNRKGSGSHRAVTVALIASMTVLGAGILSPQRTWAAWTDQSTATSGTLKAHYVQRIDSMACQGTGGLGGLLLGYYANAVFTFPHKNTAYDYVARIYNSSKVQVGGDVNISSGSAAQGSNLTYTLSAATLASLLSLGDTSYVRIYSKLKSASTWESQQYREWSVGSLSVVLVGVGIKCGSETNTSDTTGPNITFTAPTNGVNADAGTYRDNVVRPACGSNIPGCGTVSDASGVASVTYQLKRVRSTGTEYFHASSGSGGIWKSDASFEDTQLSGSTWSFDGLITTAYFDWNENMAFTLTVRATDNNGNLSTATINFTLN